MTYTLPLRMSSTRPRWASVMASPSAATILIVEEEPQLLQLLLEILLRGGHRVLRARTGPEALRLYEQHCNAVDLLIVDSFVPEIDGLLRQHPGLKVLALSDRPAAPSASAERPIPVLQKPFAPDDLLALIRWLLNG